jgi:hypothetical protein
MVRYRAVVLMALFALVSMAIHLWTGWQAAIDDAARHQQAAAFSEFLIQWTRDIFENLQSEFWQLAVQFALLAGFFEFLRVRAYEEEWEDVKQQLARIEAMLEKQR